MLSVVMLHGALLGGWVWKDVKPLLEEQGYQVMAPDLPGRGDLSGKIDLNTHVAAVSALIENAEGPVVLVAHSMSGIIAAQTAEKFPQKIVKIIYVSAYAPTNQQSLETIFADHFGPLGYDRQTMSIKIGKQLTVEDLINASFHDCPESFKELVRNRSVSEPIKPSLEKLKLSKDKFGKIPKAFVKLTEDKIIPPSLQEKMIQANDIKETYSLKTGHAPFCAAPAELASTLSESIQITRHFQK